MDWWYMSAFVSYFESSVSSVAQGGTWQLCNISCIAILIGWLIIFIALFQSVDLNRPLELQWLWLSDCGFTERILTIHYAYWWCWGYIFIEFFTPFSSCCLLHIYMCITIGIQHSIHKKNTTIDWLLIYMVLQKYSCTTICHKYAIDHSLFY